MEGRTCLASTAHGAVCRRGACLVGEQLRAISESYVERQVRHVSDSTAVALGVGHWVGRLCVAYVGRV